MGAQGVDVGTASVPRESSRRASLWWDGVRTGNARKGLAVVYSPSPFFSTFLVPEVSVVVPGGLSGLREASRLGAQLGVRSGLASLPWPIRHILVEANWGALAGEGAVQGAGQGHWAQCGDQQLLGHPAVLGLCVVTVCHRQCLDTHGKTSLCLLPLSFFFCSRYCCSAGARL